MTLTEMRTAVRTRMGNPSTDGFFTDAQLTDMINEALQAISSEDDWPWLQTSENISLTAGDGSYAPHASWTRTKQLYITNFEPLVMISLAEINEITSQGQPEYYHIYDEEILVRPIPTVAATLIHQYIAKETALSADGDTPVMPSMFHYAIVAFACYLAQLRQGRQELAQIELRAYNDWYRRMVSFRRRSQLPIRPRIRPGSWL
jgi:hypothetical protein